MVSSRKAPARASLKTLLRAAVTGLAALSALGVGVSTAGAQYVYDEVERLMPPRVVIYRLQDRGFSEISRPRFDGTAYIIDASSPTGARVRLYVDARDGSVIGRERLQAPLDAPARVARPMPGYGWTEDDAAPRRAIREAERVLPPADIPYGAPPSARTPRSEPPARSEAALRPATPARTGPADPNPFGLNPDAKGRSEAAPRKAARLAPPAKPAAPRSAPEAPAPKLKSAEAPSPTAGVDPQPKTEMPPVAAVEPPKPAPAAPTPAAVQPPPEEKPAVSERVEQAKPPAQAQAQVEPPVQAWKEPPVSEEGPKRNVRVIGGATVVPGAGEKDQSGVDAAE